MSKLTGRTYRRVCKLPTSYNPSPIWKRVNKYEVPRRLSVVLEVHAPNRTR